MAIIKPGKGSTDHRIIAFPARVGGETVYIDTDANTEINTGINKGGAKAKAKAKDVDNDEIPFIPATDLVATEVISEEVISAIGAALALSLPSESEPQSLWGNVARLEGISKRD